ncbi:acyltransferase [Paeniglutamicibacter quisquiliarum]|uniref:acyltransferase n=1 Tax=Paeniglutamicibacter quisquiliarum TaxID=2849498 RepID=UPI0020C2A5AA|nr:acyltransferase [Paeniglutamicibacter quisquiliarum]
MNEQLESVSFDAYAEIDYLKSRLIELERTVRYLSDSRAKQDPAGRPAFKRPPYVTVGEGCNIGNGVTFSATERTPILVGDRTKILRGGELLGPLTIGSRVFINRDAYIRSGVTIEDGVSLGPFVRLITDSHHIGQASHRAGPGKTEAILIGEGAWLGAGVTVLGGVTIGAGSIVAAGALVRDNVPPNSVAAGVPARVIRQLEEPQ